MSDDASEELKLVKRTFEFTLSAQEKLRVVLQTLIKEDRPLSDEERGRFFVLFGWSTIGLGRDVPYYLVVDECQGRESFGSIEKMGRFIGLQDHPMVFPRVHPVTGKRWMITISFSRLWESLLMGLLDVWPLALDRASSMSKEQDGSGGGAGYEFVPG